MRFERRRNYMTTSYQLLTLGQAKGSKPLLPRVWGCPLRFNRLPPLPHSRIEGHRSDGEAVATLDEVGWVRVLRLLLVDHLGGKASGITDWTY